MTRQESLRKPRALFICTGNTARSGMVQVLLEKPAPDRFEVVSAGLEAGGVNLMTVHALQEAELPVNHLQSEAVEPLIAEHFYPVITVCDRAEANCPVFPNAHHRMAWPFEDPAARAGTDEERLTVFRRVRDEIELKIQEWLA